MGEVPNATPGENSQTDDPGTESPPPEDNQGGGAPPADPGGAPPPADGGGDTGGGEGATQFWPDGWRERLAGEDEKFLGQLRRYTTPENFAKSWLAQRQRISSGELVMAKPDPSDEKAFAEWKKTAGVPDASGDYLNDLPDGIVFGEEDLPILDQFLESALAMDAPREYVHAALSWYHDFQETMLTNQSESDIVQFAQTEDILRAEYGADYRPIINSITSVLDTFADEETKAEILSARTPSGIRVGDHVGFIQMLASIATDINPVPAMPAGAGGTTTEHVDKEIADIRVLMADRTSDYWTGPRSLGLQERYRTLLEHRERMEGRNR